MELLFHQVWVTAHAAKTTTAVLKDFFTTSWDIWVYSVAFLIERAYSHYPRSVEEPKYKNERAVAGIDWKNYSKICRKQGGKVKIVLKKVGDIFSIYSNYRLFIAFFLSLK